MGLNIPTLVQHTGFFVRPGENTSFWNAQRRTHFVSRHRIQLSGSNKGLVYHMRIENKQRRCCEAYQLISLIALLFPKQLSSQPHAVRGRGNIRKKGRAFFARGLVDGSLKWSGGKHINLYQVSQSTFKVMSVLFLTKSESERSIKCLPISGKTLIRVPTSSRPCLVTAFS